MRLLIILSALCASCSAPGAFSSLNLGHTPRDYNSTGVTRRFGEPACVDLTLVTANQRPDDNWTASPVTVALDLGLSYSGADYRYNPTRRGAEQVRADLDTVAVRGGFRLYLDTHTRWLQPYAGAGLVLQHNRIRGLEDQDHATLYLQPEIGVESQLTKHLRVGVGWNMTMGQQLRLPEGNTDLDTSGLVFRIGASF